MSNSSEKLFGTVSNLADILGYQPNSIVSRALIDKKVGTVTLFSFDTGQGLSDHTAPYDAIVLIIDGEADVNLDGVQHRVKTGEAVFMGSGQMHNLRAPMPFKMLLIMVRE